MSVSPSPREPHRRPLVRLWQRHRTVLMFLGYLILSLTVAGVFTIKGPLMLVLALAPCLVFVRHEHIFVGTLMRWELPRLARHGSPFYLRCGYALLLLGCLAWMHLHWQVPRAATLQLSERLGEASANDLAQLAQRFVHTMLLVQNVAIYLITPIYVGSSVLEERRRGSFDFLMTTALTDQEIVVGKLLPRVAMLALVLLSGLPIYFLIQLLGGIDACLVVGGMLASLVTLLFVASVSLYCATTRTTLLGVLVQTLVLCCLPQCCCYPACEFGVNAPQTFLSALDTHLQHDRLEDDRRFNLNPPLPTPRWHTVGIHVAIFAVNHGLWISGFVVLTLRKLRPAILCSQEHGPEALFHVDRLFIRPAPLHDGINPLFWKERWLSGGRTWLYRFPLACFSGWALLVHLLVSSVPPVASSKTADLNQFLRVLNLVLFLATLLSVTFRLALTVSREREQNTLESLLTLPVAWSRLLVIKWLAALHAERWLLLLITVLWLVGLGMGAAEAAALTLLALVLGGQLLLLTGFALWLSVVCATSTRAAVTLGVTLLVWWVGAFLLLPVEYFPQYLAYNPLACLWYVPRLPEHSSNALRQQVVLPHLIYYAGGLLLLGDALRRFCRAPLAN